MRKIGKMVSGAAVLLMLAAACGGKKGRGADVPVGENRDVEVVDIDKAKQEDALLYSSILEEPDVIVLETCPECIIQDVSAIDIYEGNIYILDDKVPALYVFRRDGSFLRQIGHRGRGHGEYWELSDFSIDRENGVIYLWDDALDMAHKYDLRTNGYISSIKTKRNGYRSYSMLYLGGKLYVDRTSLDADSGNYLLKEIDGKTGTQIASCLKADDYNRGWNFPLRLPFSFFYSKNTDAPKYVGLFSDTIMAVTKEGIKPYCVVKSEDFVSKKRMKKLISDCGPGEEFNYNVSDLHEEDCIFCISRFVELDGMVSFQYRKGDEIMYLLHDVKTKETWVAPSFKDDYLFENNNIPLDMCYSDEEGVLSVLRVDFIPYFIEDVIDKGHLNPKIDEYEKLMGIKGDSNPVLFFHKYKSRSK